MKNYRFFGDEMEVLGNRLDHAPERLANSESAWARNYWSQNVERLLFQWRQLPILHDGDAITTIIPRWSVNFDFYEINGPIEYVGVTERAYDKLFRENANLDASWHSHREQRLAKAQY
jgi:hypothetical protein